MPLDMVRLSRLTLSPRSSAVERGFDRFRAIRPMQNHSPNAAPDPTAVPVSLPNPWTAADVLSILAEHGWMNSEPPEAQSNWCARAAGLLGSHAADRAALAALLSLVFLYDARTVLATVDAHVVLSRYAARDVIRQLALLLLASDGPLTPDRFQEIVTNIKDTLDVRSRDLFHPLRLALAGRSGEGELDRVVLLLDDADAAQFAQPVKPARARIVEFCAALD